MIPDAEYESSGPLSVIPDAEFDTSGPGKRVFSRIDPEQPAPAPSAGGSSRGLKVHRVVHNEFTDVNA